MGYSDETLYVSSGGHKYHPGGPPKVADVIFCEYSERMSW